MEKAPLGTTAEYNRPSGAVRTEEGRRIESGSVGKHEWSFGKRGSRMTQEVLRALPELGSRAGRPVLLWNKASRLMRRKTSTDIVKFEFSTLDLGRIGIDNPATNRVQSGAAVAGAGAAARDVWRATLQAVALNQIVFDWSGYIALLALVLGLKQLLLYRPGLQQPAAACANSGV